MRATLIFFILIAYFPSMAQEQDLPEEQSLEQEQSSEQEKGLKPEQGCESQSNYIAYYLVLMGSEFNNAFLPRDVFSERVQKEKIVIENEFNAFKNSCSEGEKEAEEVKKLEGFVRDHFNFFDETLSFYDQDIKYNPEYYCSTIDGTFSYNELFEAHFEQSVAKIFSALLKPELLKFLKIMNERELKRVSIYNEICTDTEEGTENHLKMKEVVDNRYAKINKKLEVCESRCQF